MSRSDTKPALVFGSGRSGTTWVQDALAVANGYGTLFEPLHPDAVPGAREFANLYIRPGTPHPALKTFLQKLLIGELSSVWISLRARPDRLLPTPRTFLSVKGLRYTKVNYERALRRWIDNRKFRDRPLIIKFIRGNLLIEWMLQEFDLRSAVVVRHPCAVLASVCRRSGPEWSMAAMNKLLARYLDQPDLVRDRLSDIEHILRTYRSMAEVHTAIWCIENAALIESRSLHRNIEMAYYEELVSRTSGSWTKLVRGLGLKVVPDETLLQEPSQQARYRMGEKASDYEQIESWTGQLKPEQVDDVQKVLNLFGVRRYSTQDSWPLDQSLDPDGTARKPRDLAV